MKPAPVNPFLIKQLLAAACITSIAYAAPVTKHSSGTDLTVAGSWSGGAGPAPTSADIATWDSTSLGAGLTVGSAVNWGGINITGALTNIGITGAGQITTGNITLAGNKTLSIGNAIALSGNSIYDIADVTSSTATDATLSGIISGVSLGITKTGAGTLTLSGANNYTGLTTVSAGTLVVELPGSFTSQSVYAGGFTVASGSALTLGLSNIGFGTGMQLGTIALSGGALNLDTTNAGSLFKGTTFTGNGTINKTGAGEVVLNWNGTTANSFAGLSGTFNINAGSVQFNLAGGTSDLSQVDFNLSASGTRLNLVRGVLNIGALNGVVGSTVDNTAPAAGQILTVGNNNASGTFDGVIAGGSSIALTKNGTGTQTLTGVNTYTGATTINGGKLIVNGSLAAGSAVAVNSGGGLGGTGTVNGAVTVNSGGALNLANGTTGTLTLGSTLAVNAAGNLFLDLGNGTSADKVNVTGAISGSGTIYLNQLSGTAITAGTYTLIDGGSSTSTAVLATTRAGGNVYTLNTATPGDIKVDVAAAAAGPAAAFWSGATNASWGTATNWNTDAASNSPAGAIPGVGTNVTFATTTPAATNLSNTLGADFEINSLTFNAGIAATTIGGTNMLTIDATNANGNTAGNGITANNTSGTHTISTKVGLGNSQTWTVANGGTLAVSGTVTDFGAGYTLTKAGAGTLTLSGVNTAFLGSINIQGGTLQLGNTNALTANNDVTLAAGSTNATLFFGNGIGGARIKSLTVGAGATGVTIQTQAWAPEVIGVTTLNSALTEKGMSGGAGGWNGVVFKGKITGSGAGAGNDSLILDANGQTATSGGFVWQYDGTVANDFTGNVLVKNGTTNAQQLGNNANLNVFIPDAALVTINTGSWFRWNNTGGVAVIETIDGLSGVGHFTGVGGSSVLTINANNAANNGKRDISGIVNGWSGLIIGSGTQTFSGIGDTIQSTTITVGSGATMRLSGTAHNQISTANTTLNINGTLESTVANFAQTIYATTITMNNGTLAYTNGQNTSGFGAFLVNGAKTITATGTNTISGLGVIGISSGNVLTLSPTGVNDSINVTGTIGQGASGTAGGLTKSGLGTVTLSGTNIYTGGTLIRGGRLALGSTTALADTGAVDVGNGAGGATFDLNNFNETIGALTINQGTVQSTGGTKTLTTSGVTVTGTPNTVASSAIIVGNATFGSGAALALNGALTGNATVGNGTLSGSGSVSGTTGVTSGTINGSGLTLTGLTTFNGTGNTLSGTETATAGVTLAAGAAVTQTGILTGNLNTTNTGTFTANGAVTGNATVASSGTLAGSGSIGGTTGVTSGTISGSGLTLTGLTTFNSTGNVLSGSATATAGVALASSAALANSATVTGGIAVGNGTLTGTGGSFSGASTLNGGSINLTSGSFGSTLAMTGGNWNGAGSVTGAVTSSSGTFTIGSSGNLTANGGLNVTGGTIVSGGSSSTITGSVNYTSASNSTFGGVIAGSGKTLTMNNSAATLTLTNTSTYTGATNVDSGKLVVNGNISTSNLTTVNNGGTLGGGGTLGALTVASGGILAPGNSPGILNAGNTDLQLGSNLNMELNGLTVGTDYDQLNVTGTVTLAGALNLTMGFTPVNGTLFFILANDGGDAINGTFNGLANNGTYSFGAQDFKISYFGNYDSVTPANNSFTGGNDVVLMAVPEPSAAALLGSLGVLALLRRRRN